MMIVFLNMTKLSKNYHDLLSLGKAMEFFTSQVVFRLSQNIDKYAEILNSNKKHVFIV